MALNNSSPTFDLSAAGLSFEVNLPQPFSGEGGILTGTGATMPSLQALGTSDFLTATADIPSLINDILDLAGVGEVIPPLSGSISVGIASLAYNILTADLTGSLAIGEQTTFTPTALDLTLTPNFGGLPETKPVGSSFVFKVPSGWDKPVVLTPSYSLAGTLTTQYGLAGSAEFDLSALSLQVAALGGTLQAGPVYDQAFPLVPTAFVPLYTLPAATLDLSPGNSVSSGYTIDLSNISASGPILSNAENTVTYTVDGAAVAVDSQRYQRHRSDRRQHRHQPGLPFRRHARFH